MTHFFAKNRSNFIALFIIFIFFITLLFNSTVFAQTSSRFDLAYEYQGNIYLAEMNASETLSVVPLTNDPGGGNVSPAWSPDGRYLMYTHYDLDNPVLRIIDTLNKNELKTEIPGACCGAWNPDNGMIAYADSLGSTIITASPDNNNQNIVWHLNDGLQPFGRGAWAPDGTIFFSFSQGDVATQVWAVYPDGHTEMVAASATYGDNPFASNAIYDPAISSDGSLSVTLDTSVLGYAPGGPVTLIGYAGVTRGGFGRWQAELFGGRNASWGPEGQLIAWEEWKSCTEIGIDAPGFCKAGIGIMDLNTGNSNIVLSGEDYHSPAWRPAIPVVAPPTASPSTETATQPPATITESVIIKSPTEEATMVQGGPLANDGYSPVDLSKSLFTRIWEKIVPPVEAAYTPEECRNRLAGPNLEYEGQCTWYVGKYRPDVCDWGGGNAYEWAGKAMAIGPKLGMSVRSKPQPGDIAVWLPTYDEGCGGTTKIPASGPCTEVTPGVWEGCGHVAYVVSVSGDGKTMRIKEGNWQPDRTDVTDVAILPCMKFISQISSVKITPVPPTAPIVQTPTSPSIVDSVKSWWCEYIKIGCSSSW